MQEQNFSNINFLSQSQYDSIETPLATDLYAVKIPAVIIECFCEGTEGYIVYSNKLCIQWGKYTRTSTNDTITLFKEYSNTDYNIQATFYHTTLNTDGRPLLLYETNKTVGSFVINSYTAYAGAYWQTIGYLE